MIELLLFRDFCLFVLQLSFISVGLRYHCEFVVYACVFCGCEAYVFLMFVTYGQQPINFVSCFCYESLFVRSFATHHW